jgi:hypothetical protein
MILPSEGGNKRDGEFGIHKKITTKNPQPRYTYLHTDAKPHTRGGEVIIRAVEDFKLSFVELKRSAKRSTIMIMMLLNFDHTHPN